MAQQPMSPDQRIGDHERELAVAVLRRAVADGRLGLGELDGRLDAALRARTYGEIEPVIADLGDRSLALRLSSGREPGRPPRPGSSRDDPLRLDGAQRRVGRWTAPPFISINQGSRWVRLDFQLADTESAVIDVELIGGAGWVLLVLPDGWAADTDRVSIGLGSTSVKVPDEPATGRPLLVLHGAVGAGRLRLRTPTARDRRRARRSAERDSSRRALRR